MQPAGAGKIETYTACDRRRTFGSSLVLADLPRLYFRFGYGASVNCAEVGAPALALIARGATAMPAQVLCPSAAVIP